MVDTMTMRFFSLIFFLYSLKVMGACDETSMKIKASLEKLQIDLESIGEIFSNGEITNLEMISNKDTVFFWGQLNGKKFKVAGVEATVKNNVLTAYVKVLPQFRNRHIQTFLLAELLLNNPGVNRIHVLLTEKNLEIFSRSLALRLSKTTIKDSGNLDFEKYLIQCCGKKMEFLSKEELLVHVTEAIKKTPAYKTGQHLLFPKICPDSIKFSFDKIVNISFDLCP